MQDLALIRFPLCKRSIFHCLRAQDVVEPKQKRIPPKTNIFAFFACRVIFMRKRSAAAFEFFFASFGAPAACFDKTKL